MVAIPEVAMTKKGIKPASSDVGLLFSTFNFRRMMNIIDKNEFKKFLKELTLIFSQKNNPR